MALTQSDVQCDEPETDPLQSASAGAPLDWAISGRVLQAGSGEHRPGTCPEGEETSVTRVGGPRDGAAAGS